MASRIEYSAHQSENFGLLATDAATIHRLDS